MITKILLDFHSTKYIYFDILVFSRVKSKLKKKLYATKNST